MHLCVCMYVCISREMKAIDINGEKVRISEFSMFSRDCSELFAYTEVMLG